MSILGHIKFFLSGFFTHLIHVKCMLQTIGEIKIFIKHTYFTDMVSKYTYSIKLSVNISEIEPK